MALVILVSGCGVSISPVPGVSVYIPIPHDDGDKRDREEKANQYGPDSRR